MHMRMHMHMHMPMHMCMHMCMCRVIITDLYGFACFVSAVLLYDNELY